MTDDRKRGLRDPFDGPQPWGDDDIMGPDIQVADLAQRALGDAFDQLVRVGSAGSSQCHRYSQVPYSEAERIDPQTAAALLTSAKNALRYAELQLQHLTRNPPQRGGELDEELDEETGDADVDVSSAKLWGLRALDEALMPATAISARAPNGGP